MNIEGVEVTIQKSDVNEAQYASLETGLAKITVRT